jgi:glucokinase
MLVGIDLGGTKILTAVSDDSGRLISSVRIETEAKKGPKKVIENIVKSVQLALAKPGIKMSQVKKIGIGTPGPVINQSTIVHAPNIPGFKNFNIKKALERKFKKPVIVENDANAAAYAEYMFGAGKGSKNMVYITISTGIGGGIILDGKLYQGSFGTAGEIGHMVVQPGGNKCGCGNRGCLEAMAAGPYIAKAAGKKNAIEVKIAALKGNKIAQKAIGSAANYIGMAIADLNNLLDPDIFVIGGGVSNMGSLLFKPMIKAAKANSMTEPRKHLKIVAAKLNNNVGVMGAISLCLNNKSKVTI